MFTMLLLALRLKTPFLANSFRPCFCEVSVAGHDGGVSRDFEPLGPFELFLVSILAGVRPATLPSRQTSKR